MPTQKIYKFSDHLESVKWIDELPSGYLSDEIDLGDSIVNIKKENNEYNIYVGPLDPYKGGSALTVVLDKDLRLIDFEAETLAAVPDDESK